MATVSATPPTLYTGKAAPAWPFTLLQDSGTPLNITDATLEAYMLNALTLEVVKLQGALTILNASTGRASYQWTLDDLSLPGRRLFYLDVTLPAEAPRKREFNPVVLGIFPTPEFIGGLIMQEVDLAAVNGAPNSVGNPVFVQLVAAIVSHVIVDSLPALAANAGVNIGSVELLDGAGSNKLTIDGSGNAAVKLTSSSIATGSAALAVLSSTAPGYVAAYGSNPTALTSNTDAAFKWGGAGNTQVNHVMIQNNTAASLNWDLDVATSAGSPTLAAGQTLFLDVQTSAVHLQQTGTPNINGSSSANIVVRGWL
jgi:hypothetical protein